MNIRNGAVMVAVLITGVFYSSCRKKSVVTPDPSAVVITVQNPQKGQVFHKGDTVNITANVTYITELHGYYLQLIDTTTLNILFANTNDIHDDHFTIQQQWVDTFSQARNLQLIINANLDHNGTEAADTVWITTKP